MLTFIGGDVSVPNSTIVGIYGYSTLDGSINEEFMAAARGSGQVLDVTDKRKIKSVVVTDKRVYLSPIAAATLKKRANNIYENNIFEFKSDDEILEEELESNGKK